VFPLLRAGLAFRAALLELVEQHLETLVPGYTHLQQAQPITLGHYFLAFVHQQERDFERLSEAYPRLNVSPMGLAILGGSGYPLDRERVADLLGFVGLIRNGRDLSDRDYAAELAAACSIAMMHVHRLATDLFIWSTQEFGFVRVDDSDAMTSSIMPQKANPVLLETTLAATARVHGDLMAVLGSLKGSTANNTEAGQADGPALRAMDETAWTLEMLGAMVGRMQVDRDVMRRQAADHWAQATDLADALVRESDLSFRQAHRVVGAVVAKALEERRRPADTTPADVRTAAERVLGRPIDVSPETVAAALDPWQGVLVRRLLGGPAPDVVRAQVAEARDQLGRDQQHVDSLESAVADARRRLEAAADHVLSVIR
jgi:argininosuccinate lyase